MLMNYLCLKAEASRVIDPTCLTLKKGEAEVSASSIGR